MAPSSEASGTTDLGSATPSGLTRAPAKSVKSYGRIGDLEVRLATTKADVQQAQALRYQVFYEEMTAKPNVIAKLRRRDEDPYDAICDHLLVVDVSGRPLGQPTSRWNSGRVPQVVGTYRVLRQDVAERTNGFYTQGEYDIAPLIASKPNNHFLELGRSCVLKPYRNKRTVELLWHGLWTYVRETGVDVMLGCASFPGTNPEDHATALSFLHHNALAPEEWRCRAHEELFVPMDRMPPDAIDTRTALKTLPPLIKGYLRLGAFVGDGAVIDHQFGTTDVMVIMPVQSIDPRYFEHFGAPDERQSRISSAR